MSARFEWSGLEALKASLRALPEELTAEGGHIVEVRANGATATIKAGYPRRSGSLAAGMDVTHSRSRFGARSVVKNSDKDAAVFERGSQARHTRIGANRGSMPANHLFTKTMMRERRGMYQDLRDLLVRKGLVVTGDV